MTAEIFAAEAAIDTLAIAILRRQLRGALLEANDEGYDAAREVVNARHDRRPALIARCQTAEDVALSVAFARREGLEIAVRSGGHSVAGHSTGDGVMVIDLSRMNAIDVDPAGLTARIGPGASNGRVVLALQEHGLATTTGTCATVGMGGSTLGGGIGWLMGRFGATIDNVLAFELVSAEGAIITASDDEHPELFWALRGGGGNFGVVTAITYRLHKLGPVLGGMLAFPLVAAPLVLRMYRQLAATAPDELIAHVTMATVPNIGPVILVQAIYSGEDLAEGERLLAPLRAFGPPALDLIAPRPYAEAYMMLTPPPHRVAAHDAAYSLRNPSDAALDELFATALARPTPGCAIVIHQFHGAAARVPADATAFALREEHLSVVNVGAFRDGAGEAEAQWAQQARDRMAPHASSGVYVNFLGYEGDGAVRATYRANYERLAAVKAEYDPENVFRRNQNIKPGVRREA